MVANSALNGLALEAAKGNSQAFRQLLENQYDLIYRLALRFCRHREEAEDIAQDVCVILAKSIKTFEGKAAFSTWLYRIVLNRVRDMKRKSLTSERLNRDYVELEAMQREAAFDKARQLDWLYDVMAELSEDLRETAALIVGEEMSHAQAAEILGIKEGTVSWRMSELKKALRQMAKETA